MYIRGVVLRSIQQSKVVRAVVNSGYSIGVYDGMGSYCGGGDTYSLASKLYVGVCGPYGRYLHKP